VSDSSDHGTVQLMDGALGARLRRQHEQLLEMVPELDRIACALYDPSDDLLKTFVNSTRSGEPIQGYEFRLSESASLSQLARTGETRVLDDIPGSISATNLHSIWLLEQCYRSSLTVPLYDKGDLIGFLFYDSCKPAAFSAAVQRNLALFSTLMNMTISNELNLVRSITTSAQVAREFANLRDFETGGHLERMAHYTRLIARELQQSHGLSDETIEHLYLFAPLHDIGKIGVPDRILNKRGALDPEEMSVMRRHAAYGAAVLRGSGSKVLEMARQIALSHHEKFDGSGYPQGLRGEAIPLEARIVAVADVFDALTTRRPYKEPWPVAVATDHIRKESGAHFDPLVIDAFVAVLPQVVRISEALADPADPAAADRSGPTAAAFDALSPAPVAAPTGAPTVAPTAAPTAAPIAA